MKKTILLILLLTVLLTLFAFRVKAEEVNAFHNSIEELKSSVDPNAIEWMKQLGVSGADVMQATELSLSDSLGMIGDMIADAINGPFSSLILLSAVIVLTSLLESYSFSLRYVNTKEVMNTVTSLMVITVLVTPVISLIRSSTETIQGAATLMLVFAPVMMGILAFSGHLVQSGGYYAAVMAASQGIAQLSSSFFAPVLNMLLALSVSSAISERVRLNGICELFSKLIKWTLTFAMTLYTAVVSIQGFAGNAADSVASKAARFTLSSFVPIIGGSLSEAYRAIRGSIGLLRSGVGVFVIIAMIVTFLPLMIRVILWQLAVLAAKTAADAFDIPSAVTVLGSVSQILSVLMALIATVSAVFLVSSGVLIAVGGGL